MFKIAQSKQELQDVFDVRIEVFVHEQNVPLENELDEFEDVSTHIIGYDENNRPSRLHVTEITMVLQKWNVLQF